MLRELKVANFQEKKPLKNLDKSGRWKMSKKFFVTLQKKSREKKLWELNVTIIQKTKCRGKKCC